MISEKTYNDVATLIGCEVNVIKAVAKVESNGSGFLKSGEVIILFEPHIFWRKLTERGIKPDVSDICYPKWKTGTYGPVTEQHKRLQRAVKINRDAALESCSWGMFQIMAFNWKKTGSKSLQDFVNRSSKSEDEQLRLFGNFIINSGLADELREKRFTDFAFVYNGKEFWKNKYDEKILNEYNRLNKK